MSTEKILIAFGQSDKLIINEVVDNRKNIGAAKTNIIMIERDT
jgi:hypothetical protein